MSGSTLGNKFTITTWGESHGKAIGVVVDGCPAGLPLCEDDIQIFLNRRRPGYSQFSTPSPETKALGLELIEKELNRIPNEKVRQITSEHIHDIAEGKRDFRF